ncbi:MAG: xylose isomerase [Planctomycetaceae bacterium]|nr:MAG: xylose isomerase [Planctomycetaceae bacterium]
MWWGYNTNGLAHHRLEDAVRLIAETGYRAVGLTLDHHCLDPRDDNWPRQLQRVRRLLVEYRLRCVVETGGRFILDPWRKHQPTLLSTCPEARQRRYNYLLHALQIAQELQADALSFWSGSADQPTADHELWSRLCEGCERLCTQAEQRQVRLAFEPEPGMFIETCDQFQRLYEHLGSRWFGLTLDVGHVHCLQDGSPQQRIEQWASSLFNVHLEDMRVGEHLHLPLGEGTLDLPGVIRTLQHVQYPFGVYVELSRDSHRAPEMLRQSLSYLRTITSSGSS